MKKIIFIIFFAIIFTFNVSAEEYSEQDIINEQYEISGISDIFGNIDEEYRSLFNEINIDPSTLDGFDELNIQNIFTYIFGVIKNTVKSPFAVVLSIFSISVIGAMCKGLSPENESIILTTEKIGSVAAAFCVLLPAYELATVCINSLKAATSFMSGFVPIFAGIVITSGKATTATLTSSTLLISSQIIQQITSGIILPITIVFLALNTASCFSDVFNFNSISNLVKKTVGHIMTAVMFIFSAVTSVQTFIGNSTDSAGLKTARFIASGTPIIGGAVSEAVGMVTSCLNTLRGTVGIYAVLIFLSIFIPVLIYVFLWQIAMKLSSIIAAAFNLGKIAGYCSSVGHTFEIINSVIVNTFIMFTVSLTVVCFFAAGG